MGRKRIYNTPEEAHAAKLKSARESYKRNYVKVVERKKWGFKYTTITEDMIGKTIKELEDEYKKSRVEDNELKTPNEDINEQTQKEDNEMKTTNEDINEETQKEDN